MKASLLLATALMAIMCPAFAHAQGAFITGSQLAEDLEAFNAYYTLGNKSDLDKAIMGSRGVGYIFGTFDTLSRSGLICAPTSVNAGQAQAIVLKYLRDNPDKWNQPAAELVFTAYHNLYPCIKSPAAK